MDNRNSRVDSMSDKPNTRRKVKKTGHKELIKNHLLDGEEIDRVYAATHNMGMDLATRISNLRLDYKMKIKQRPASKNRPNGPFIYWMMQDDIKEYQSTNSEE
jgi:hypothetical protein